MERLNDILYEVGISKVKLAKYLGVSRQMVYNYLEVDDLHKWPKDKRVMLLNLLGLKTVEELDDLKIDTDYIQNIEMRINSLFDNKNDIEDCDNWGEGLKKDDKVLLKNIILAIKERLGDDDSSESYNTFKYMYHFIQSLDTNKELKYILAYVSKMTSFTPDAHEFVFNDEEQFIFESIMFSAMTLYNSGGASKSKLTESHRRFANQIEHKLEEKMSRTLELNSAKVQALKELGYTEISEKNAAEVLEKIAEIQSRKVVN
ncbi:MAG: hypothetical protein PHE54_02645 [Bacilli bacterium]|nr:hypothetical protein [Bacilli bacterium]